MNSRERIISALTHKDPDRTPMFEYVLLSPVADVFLKRPYVDFAGGTDDWDIHVSEKGWENTIRQHVADKLDLAGILGHDMLYVLPNPLPPEMDEKAGEDTGPVSDDPVENMISRNEADEKHLDGFDTNILEKSFLIYHYLREEMKNRGMDLPVLAPAYYHGIWTDVDLMQTIVLEPDVARKHFELATRQAMLFIDKYLAVGIEMIGIGGDFAGNRLIISPQAYREMIVPEVRKLSDIIRKAGSWSVNATDGNIWPVLDDFITGCGTDGYLEVDMRAGMDLVKLKEAYGDRVTLFGNMDCGEVLSFYDPDRIGKITVECLDAGMDGGGHIFCASNAITGSVPVGNYLAMVNAYRSYFGIDAVKIDL